MPARVKVNIQLRAKLGGVVKRMPRMSKDLIKGKIEKRILSGMSPVKQWGKFDKYSRAYAKQKGVSRNQVDMTLSGKMMNSLEAKATRRGIIEIFFKDKKASYHHNGKGELPARRLLPTGRNEVFIKDISDFIIATLRKVVRKQFRSR